MKWPKPFSRLRRTSSPSTSHLDLRLLKNVRHRFVPNWRQFRYIPKFLSKGERLTLLIAGGSAVVMAIVILIGLLSHHLTFLPTHGGEYSEALIGQPKYINPLFASVNDTDADLTALIYAGLFHYSPSGQLEPYLADSYTVSSDGKVYTVHLRPGVVWSDGEPLTIDDVVYTFQEIQNPEVASPLFPSFHEVKIEKVDDSTVRFTLNTPFAPFLNTLTVGILPLHVWGDIPAAAMRLAKNNLQPIGAGQWQFSKLSKDNTGIIQSYTLIPNNNFFGDKPFFNTVLFKFYNDYPDAVEALRNHQVSAVSFLPHDPKSKVSTRDTKFYQISLPQYTALFLNQNQVSALTDLSIRTALAEAIDKNSLIQDALQGNGQVIDGPLVTGSADASSTSNKIAFNPDDAATLLDKKWSRLSPEDYFKLRHDQLLKEYQTTNTSDSSSTPIVDTASTSTIEDQITTTIRREMNNDQPYFRQDKNGNILSLVITTVDNPEYVRAANAIAAAWRKIGVISAVQAINSHQINYEVLRDRNYQVLLYGEITGLDPDLFPFWHSSQVSYPGLNIGQFADRNADKLLEDARENTDPQKRADSLSKFQDILASELPAIFLYQPTYNFAIEKDVRGVSFGPLNSPADRYSTIGQWYLKTTWHWK